MEIIPGQIIYEKTKDPNIVLCYSLNVSEIHIPKLESKILELQNNINNVLSLKNVPDKETLDYWNAVNTIPQDPAAEKELEEKQELLTKIKTLEVEKVI